MLSQEPLLIAQEQGMRSTILATMLKSRVYGIIANPDITEISQLKGSTVYGSDPGSAPYTFSCTVFEKAGLDPMKDLTFMQMDANSAIMALDNGEVKAAFINISKVPELRRLIRIFRNCLIPSRNDMYNRRIRKRKSRNMPKSYKCNA